MAHFLDVIVTVHGFQHGEDEFTLKAMAAVVPSVAFQWLNVYHTAFLEDRLWGHLQTYRTQAHYHAMQLGLQEPCNTWRRTSVLGFVPSTVSVSQTKMSPISTSPDLDQGHPQLVFRHDVTPTISA